MIKAIIFDFAGVIGTDGYWVWLKEVVPDLESKRNYFQTLADKVDKGIITNQQSVLALANATRIPPNEVWPQVYVKIIINKSLVEYIEELKRHYKLGILSNFTYEWLEDLIEKHNLIQYFDAVVISSRHKVLKPESAAFQKILSILQISPKEAIFIDDRQIHIDGASKVGIKGLLYTTNEKLRQDLLSLGIKT